MTMPEKRLLQKKTFPRAISFVYPPWMKRSNGYQIMNIVFLSPLLSPSPTVESTIPLQKHNRNLFDPHENAVRATAHHSL